LARCQWFTLVILTTWEAEIRRIIAQQQPREIVHKTLAQKPFTKRTGAVAQCIGLEFKPLHHKKKRKKKVYLVC
jgi:hypothetical protein